MAATPALPIILRCDEAIRRRVRYVFDTLFQAAGILTDYVNEPPGAGPWLLYAQAPLRHPASSRALFVAYLPAAWRLFEDAAELQRVTLVEELPAVAPERAPPAVECLAISFDIVANAFYFLSSWAERVPGGTNSSRQLFSNSVFERLDVPQDIVDRYLHHLLERLGDLCARGGFPKWPLPEWPGGKRFAVVLSHDVDFLPVGPLDNAAQAAKTLLRHLIRQRDPGEAWRAMRGFVAASLSGRDPYGCVPEIIAREQAMGVRSSFQVAVGHRHSCDVNYYIEDDGVRDYLRAITDAGFDLCLHGSYRSTENPDWYAEEVELLAHRLDRPRGSRQHFLSFDYDNLFAAQENAGVEYDMSVGYPDRPGSRSGFSYPYFPYNLREDRPYRVVQIGLFLMDVTLRGYLGHRAESAGQIIETCLLDLSHKRGGASAVWHPIVFGGARDPGYDRLYFHMVERIGELGGLATDGRTVNAFWRNRACDYASFNFT